MTSREVDLTIIIGCKKCDLSAGLNNETGIDFGKQ